MREIFTSGSVGGLVEQSLSLPGQTSGVPPSDPGRSVSTSPDALGILSLRARNDVTDTLAGEDVPVLFRPIDLAVLLILVVGHAAFNVLFAPFGLPESEYPARLAYPAIGVIGVQPILFAMWAALSPSFVKRLPWAVSACAIVAYAQSLRSLRLIAPSTASGDVLVSMFFVLAVFVAATLVLLLVRQRFSCCIDSNLTGQALGSSKDSQFGIRHLLAWTAASAVLLALGRFLAPFGASTPAASDLKRGAAQIAGFLGMFCLFLFPTVAVPWITLTFRRGTALLVTGALSSWAALTWATISVLGAVTPSSQSQATEAVVLIQVGAAAAGFVTALALRVCGFRIRRVEHLARRKMT